MKTLIEKSIKFRGIGRPETLTIFNIENENEKLLPLYKSLTVISGRTLTVMFDVDNEGVKESLLLPLTILRSEEEEVIKQYVLDQINNFLNS